MHFEMVNAGSSVSKMERPLYKYNLWLQEAVSLPGAVFSVLPPALLKAERGFPALHFGSGKEVKFFSDYM